MDRAAAWLAVLGSVVFDLTFFNEVTQSHETLRLIHAQVIDSCIAVIISRPVIRENHKVHRIPLYFDEGTLPGPAIVARDNTINMVARSLVAHAPHLWHKATTTPNALSQC